MDNKRKFFPAAAGILGILAALLVIIPGCGRADDKESKKQSTSADASTEAVLYLGGYAVSAEEYQMLAREYSNQITMQYETEQVNSGDFWEQEIDGTAPYMLLEDIILDELKKNYALKSLAAELEVVEDYTYTDLLDFMEAENSSGESGSSYGLSSYDESTYYKYWYSNLETQVVSALVQERITVTQADCEDYYEENLDACTYETGVTILYAEIPFDSAEEGDAWNTAYGLSKAMEELNTAEEIEETFADIQIEELELTTFDTQAGMSGIYTRRWEIASQLSAGDVYGPYEDENTYCVMKCTERTENGTLDFASVQGQIERYLQIQEAQEMIGQQAESLEIRDGELSAKDAILDAL